MSKHRKGKPIIKVCFNCKEYVVVIMQGTSGFCPGCKTRLYETSNKMRKKKYDFNFKRIHPKNK